MVAVKNKAKTACRFGTPPSGFALVLAIASPQKTCFYVSLIYPRVMCKPESYPIAGIFLVLSFGVVSCLQSGPLSFGSGDDITSSPLESLSPNDLPQNLQAHASTVQPSPPMASVDANDNSNVNANVIASSNANAGNAMLSLIPSFVSENHLQLSAALVGPDEFAEVIALQSGSLFASLLTKQGGGQVVSTYRSDNDGLLWSPLGQISNLFPPSVTTVLNWSPIELRYRASSDSPNRILLALALVDNSSSQASIQINESDDGGNTWDQVILIPCGKVAAFSDVSLIVDDQQNVQLYWMQRDFSASGLLNQQCIYRIISSDFGASWSSRTAAVSTGNTPRFPSVAHVPAFGLHTLVMVTEDNVGTSTQGRFWTFVQISSNNGATWTKPTLLLSNSDPNIFVAVPRATNRGNATLLITTSTNEPGTRVDTSGTGGRLLKTYAFMQIPSSKADAVAGFEAVAPLSYRYSMASTTSGNLVYGYADSATTAAISLVTLK